MKASHELDALVAEKVMGNKYMWGPFEPSIDMSDAWKVVEKITEERRINLFKLPGGMWSCKFSDLKPFVEETAPLAICLAALYTKGVEV